MGRLVFGFFAVLVVVWSGCGRGDDDGVTPTPGDERGFRMGISTLPRELNADAYAETFELAGEAGDAVLIRRSPPWEEFLPGASVSEATADTTAAEIAAIKEQGLELFFAIDPTDGATGRDRLVGLPPGFEGKTFQDEQIQAAFISYAEYVAVNYKPAYLALGVEMNLFLREKRDEIAAFHATYLAARQRVLAASGTTKVTLTFQYEDMQSILPTETPHFPAWDLLALFEEAMDVTAISTYPSLAFGAVDDLPANYYSQLRAFADPPIVIAEMGWASSSAPSSGHRGSEEEQAAFVTRMLREADALSMPLIVWFAGWDPDYTEGTAFEQFQHIGLLHTDGSEKAAWPIWQEAAQRPFQSETARIPRP